MFNLSSLYVLSFGALISASSMGVLKQFSLEPNVVRIEQSPLASEDNFVIFYAFSEGCMEQSLKEVMIRSFEKLGMVHLGDDSKLTETQRKEKYKIGGGLLHVIATPIIEENSSSISDYKVLPVLELSLQVVGGVESLSNETQFCSTLWEKRKFIDTNSDKEMVVPNAIKGLEDVLDAFILEYKKANPNKRPQFFLYS